MKHFITTTTILCVLYTHGVAVVVSAAAELLYKWQAFNYLKKH